MSRMISHLFLPDDGGGFGVRGLSAYPKMHRFESSEEEWNAIQEYRQIGSGIRKTQLGAIFYRTCFPFILRTAGYYARKVGVNAHDATDLVQEGALGVFDAIGRFDPQFGARFTTYAQQWISARILKALSTYIVKRMPYRVDHRVYGQISQILEAVSIAEARGLDGTEPEVLHGLLQEFEQKGAKRMSVNVIYARLLLIRECGDHPSETERVSGATPRRLPPMLAASVKHSGVSSETLCLFRQKHREMKEALHRLELNDPPAARVIRLRFGLVGRQGPLNLAQIGRVIGLSRERARQLQNRGLDKLGITEDEFRNYLSALDVLPSEQLVA